MLYGAGSTSHVEKERSPTRSIMPSVASRTPSLLPWLAVLALCCLLAPAWAQDASDPPARVAYVSERQGSVVFAPQGEEEWQDLPANRPLTPGDRLWTDAGARAELQLGTATLHVNSQAHLGLSDLDEHAAQFMLQQGSINAHVREVVAGENFEVDTPNVAVRALQRSDFRVDVDPQAQQTRVIVRSGVVAVFGEGGQSINLGTSQEAVFAGRYLAQVSAPPYADDAFAAWAAERNRQEDEAIATRFVPRGVVGAPELDAYGTWSQEPEYGAVWYPAVTVANWAPYRYGHWSWIAPWGWTWIDDAPWGFAPFHYGRWTMIGTRWAWVPGRLAPRPVYAPALVAFVGGGGSFTIGSGPAVGWYPLAPGEAWWPWYRSSTRYVSAANYRVNLGAYPRNFTGHYWRQHPTAVTTVRVDDFRRGRSVERVWQPVAPQVIERGRPGVVPARPVNEFAPRPRATAPAMRPDTPPSGFVPPAVRDQYRAQQEQEHLQRQAERDARDQMRNQAEARTHQQGNAGRVDSGTWQRDAGRVDSGSSQRDAGRVDSGTPQREAGRVQNDQPGSDFDAGRRPSPRMWRQSTRQPAQPVPVPRQQVQGVARHERAAQAAPRAAARAPAASHAQPQQARGEPYEAEHRAPRERADAGRGRGFER
jgi:hypothetical protein